MKSHLSVLFLGKENDEHCRKAQKFIENNFSNVISYLGKWGDPLPEDICWWQGDYIISYLSRWLVPQKLIENAHIAAINFHPGPPDYPGIGCNNFALYDEVETYGVTCHLMAPKVDSGEIISTKKFPVFPVDDVASLLSRTYDHQLVLFYETMDKILHGQKINVSGEKWGRKPFSRAEFNQLPKITAEMDAREVSRRVRATKFNEWKPSINVGGFEFDLR